MRTALVYLIFFGTAAFAAEIHPPAQTTAGKAITIRTSGSGDATFYLIGPAAVSKRDVQAGLDISVDSGRLEHAGRYVAILCVSDGCTSASFFVNPAAPNRLSFLVRPSRVPVDSTNAISAVAFVQDNFRNLVLKPEAVTFSVWPKDGKPISVRRTSKNAVAWVRLSSAHKEGATRLAAAIGNAHEVRVVQQVAADACNLRIKSSRSQKGVLVETDPVRDCAGNPVPDGTIVSFTKSDEAGKTTVDVPIKKGVARIEMPVEGSARITVASGVVTGNELRLGGRP